jgi:hypothetical protein
MLHNADNLQINSHFHTKKVPLQFIHTIHAVKYLTAKVTNFSLHFTSTGVQCLSQGLPTYASLFPVLVKHVQAFPTPLEKRHTRLLVAWFHRLPIPSWTPCLQFTRSYTEFSSLAENRAERKCGTTLHRQMTFSLAGSLQVCMTLHTWLLKAVT